MMSNLREYPMNDGPPDQVVIVRLATSNGCARICVDDQGPGIPAADRERVWDRFWRLERDRGSAIAGTGIGLAGGRGGVAPPRGRPRGGGGPPRAGRGAGEGGGA